MKNAKRRDIITQNIDILYFEMKAAGLMDQLPCLLIQEICDYYNSHKHKVIYLRHGWSHIMKFKNKYNYYNTTTFLDVLL
jgi:nucleoside phosphorylase